MKNSHAIIDSKTCLVRNVVIWDGGRWLPPLDHFVVNDCDGQIGDYWDRDSNIFYTKKLKRRIRVEDKVGEAELTDEEKNKILPILTKVYGVQE
jgi:hypothetical protein